MPEMGCVTINVQMALPSAVVADPPAGPTQPSAALVGAARLAPGATLADPQLSRVDRLSDPPKPGG